MKKLLPIILVLGLVWSGSAYAKEVKWKLPIFIDGKMVERHRQETERLNRERSNNGNTRVCSYVGNSIVCKDRGY